MGCGASGPSNARNGVHPMTAEMMELPPRRPTPVSSNALQQFIQVENAILDYEKSYDVDNYNVKQEQLDQLEQSVTQLMQVKEQMSEHSEHMLRASGEGLVTSTKEFLDKRRPGVPLTNAEENVLDHLNRQEIVDAELASVMEQRRALQKELEAQEEMGRRINELHSKRDKILDTIFVGKYGSDVESVLEKELDYAIEQKHHVDSAYFRWKQAQRMAKEAVGQIAEAIQKWKFLATIPLEDYETRYFCAAEARNLLVSCSQNVHGSIRYLPNIDVPYCNDEELETLDKAISFIFTDMLNQERYQHALGCYNTSYKRVAALYQWFTQVLNQSISVDMAEVTQNCKSKAAELRNERIKLIKNRMRESNNSQDSQNGWDKVASVELRDSGVDSELGDSISNEELSRLFERKGTSSTTPDPTPDLLVMPTPLPSAELAPMPDPEQIFGKIEMLRNRHQQDVVEFSRTQKMTQARMAQGLKDKLQQRRSRRSRLEMHSRQMEALKEL